MQLKQKFKIKSINGRRSRAINFIDMNVGDVFEVIFNTAQNENCSYGNGATVTITRPDGLKAVQYVCNLHRIIKGEGPKVAYPTNLRWKSPEYVKQFKINEDAYKKRLSDWTALGRPDKYELEEV